MRPGWAISLTYGLSEGWLYLAVLIDFFSRRVVGWSMGARINQELTLRALRMALCSRRPQAGLINHTDPGSLYAVNDYSDMLKGAEATISMSRKGDAQDNAVSESFFATLKNELVHACNDTTRHEATGDILRYWLWYNAHRLHSTLDYVSLR